MQSVRSVPLIAIPARLLANVDYTERFLGISIPSKKKALLIPISSMGTQSLNFSFSSERWRAKVKNQLENSLNGPVN